MHGERDHAFDSFLLGLTEFRRTSTNVLRSLTVILVLIGGRIEFKVKIIPYEGNDNWIEGVILKAHKCLISDTIPERSADCDYCRYREEVIKVEK